MPTQQSQRGENLEEEGVFQRSRPFVSYPRANIRVGHIYLCYLVWRVTA